MRLNKVKLGVRKDYLTRRTMRVLARRALIERLRRKGAEADVGLTIDTTGLSDEEFVALLRR